MNRLKIFKQPHLVIGILLLAGLLMQCGRQSQYERFGVLVQNWESFEKMHHPLMLSRHSLKINLPKISPDFFTDYTASLDSLGNELALLDSSALADAEKMYFELFSNYIHREKDWYSNQQSWQTDLWFYIEIIGNSLYHPIQAQLTEYDKVTLITSRLEQLPTFLSQIRANVPQPDGAQLEVAVAAVRQIETYLAQDFLKRSRKLPVLPDNFSSIYQTAISELGTWEKTLKQQLKITEKSARLGEIELDRRLDLWFGDNVNSQEMLSVIATEKERVFSQLLKTAADVYHRYFPKRRLNLSAVRKNPTILKRAFKKVRNEHIPPALWPEEIRYTMKIIHQFLDLRSVFPVPSQPEIDISWLPPHARVLYFEKMEVSDSPTGAVWQLYLQPALFGGKNKSLNAAIQGEFNPFMLKNLAVELLPGHVLQQTSFDSLTFPGFSRYGDPAVTLGWPLYASHVLESAGFTGYHPNFKLVRLMRYYRVLISAELALKYHIGVLEPETVKIILAEDAFLSEPQLSVFWRQICLQPEQNIGKIWGYLGLENLRRNYNHQKKNQYLINIFNQQLISAGIIPIDKLQTLLLEEESEHGE
ncbi:DUF885 family protein [bacterium]|nr:DUF885 family protein [bacterium]